MLAERAKDQERKRQARANATEEDMELRRAKDRERKRLARAKGAAEAARQQRIAARAKSRAKTHGRQRVATTRAFAERTAVEEERQATRERAHVAQDHAIVGETELLAYTDGEGETAHESLPVSCEGLIVRQNTFALLDDSIVPPILTEPAPPELVSVADVPVHNARGHGSVEPMVSATVLGPIGLGHPCEVPHVATRDEEVLALLRVLLASVNPTQPGLADLVASLHKLKR